MNDIVLAPLLKVLVLVFLRRRRPFFAEAAARDRRLASASFFSLSEDSLVSIQLSCSVAVIQATRIDLTTVTASAAG